MSSQRMKQTEQQSNSRPERSGGQAAADRLGMRVAAGGSARAIAQEETRRARRQESSRPERRALGRGLGVKVLSVLPGAAKRAGKAEGERIADEAFGGSDEAPHSGADEPVDADEATVHLGDLAKETVGASNRPNVRKARKNYYFPLADGALTTTRQAEVMNPALLAAPTDEEGIAIGMDLLTNASVAHDPFTAYRKKVLSSPHVVVLGVIGSGKSSLIKTVYVLRPLVLKGRRAVVLDRKDQEGEGEYAALTRKFGAEPYRFVIGEGGTSISPLDPRILAVIGRSGQLRLLNAMAARARGVDLDEWDSKALRIAHTATLRAAEQEGRVPVLDTLVPLLGNLDVLSRDERGSFSGAAAERLHQAGVSMRFALEQVLSDELNGLFDGETSRDVHLNELLTTFDISQLPVDGPATAMVLAVAHTWLLGTLRRDRGMGTNFVVEEGWDMMAGPIAKHLNASQMLARGLGLSNVAALHHVAQAASSAEGASLLREPQTVHLYRQDREEDVQACVSTYGLDAQSAESLRNLGQGNHLLKIGSRPEVMVAHKRSPLEMVLTDTDSAMEMRSGQAVAS